MAENAETEEWEYYDDNTVLPDFWQVQPHHQNFLTIFCVTVRKLISIQG